MPLTDAPLCACPHSQGLCGRPSVGQCAACGRALCRACDMDTDGVGELQVGPGLCEDCYFKRVTQAAR